MDTFGACDSFQKLFHFGEVDILYVVRVIEEKENRLVFDCCEAVSTQGVWR